MLTTQEPRQTIIHHFQDSLNQLLSLCGNTTTNLNVLNSNAALPVTYITNRLVLHSYPMHFNSEGNDCQRFK